MHKYFNITIQNCQFEIFKSIIKTIEPSGFVTGDLLNNQRILFII